MHELPPITDPVQAQRRIKRAWMTIGILVGVCVVAVVVNVLVFGVEEKDDHADVVAGDCFQNTGTDKSPHIKKLDCGDAHADYQALKKIKSSITEMSCWGVEGATGALTQVGSESFTVCFKRNPH